MHSANEDHTQLFARIRLHGITKSSSDGKACPIELERRTTFPVPVDYGHGSPKEHNKDLSARCLLPIYDIEARVCIDRPIADPTAVEQDPVQSFSDEDPEGALGAGRAGVVYPLEILSFNRVAPQAQGPDHQELEEPLEPPALPPLCIKIASPGHARNLAREAWFYEQLDAKGLTRLISPRCYGVFHTPAIPDDLKIDIPGYNYYKRALMRQREECEDCDEDHWHQSDCEGCDRSDCEACNGTDWHTACLSEEYRCTDTLKLTFHDKHSMDDKKGSYTNSEWKLFRETPTVTTMTVLVMDMLGACLTVEDFERDWEEELNDIWDHLMLFDVIHSDVRFPNVLRVPPHLQVPCPMHPHAIPGHRWNLTDWEGAKITAHDMSYGFAIWGQRFDLVSYYRLKGGKKQYKRRFIDIQPRLTETCSKNLLA